MGRSTQYSRLWEISDRCTWPAPAELKRRLAADRAGTAYLLYRDPGAGERILPLQESAAVIGRDAACDAPLTWDEQVSRLHVELANLRGHWLVIDDGLSRNGTFVNGERVVGRRRLHNGDQLLVGSTTLLFCEAQAGDRRSTAVPGSGADRVERLAGPASRARGALSAGSGR